MSISKDKLFKEIEADIVIIGGGVAGMSAATAAAWSGKKVILVERSKILGGTARYANGSIWIPNNHLAATKGIHHSVEDELLFILSECWSTFSQSSDCHGVDRNIYERAKRYIEEAAAVIRDLEVSGVQKFTQLEKIFKAFFYSDKDSIKAVEAALIGKQQQDGLYNSKLAASESWDYKWENTYNRVPYGKHVWSSFDARATGLYFYAGLEKHWRHILQNMAAIRSFHSFFDQFYKLPTKLWGLGHGLILAERFHRHLKRSNVKILLEHDFVDFCAEAEKVNSILLKSTCTNEYFRCKINDALIISSGCSSQSLITSPRTGDQTVRSTCVSHGSDGKVLKLLEQWDVKFDKYPKPLYAQTPFQKIPKGRGLSQDPVFFLYGDSFFIIDRDGKRVGNEKLNYHDRASIQRNDADKEFLFLIGDKRFKERGWGFGIGLPFDSSAILEGRNFKELQDKVDALFQKEKIDFKLNEDFAETANMTLERFNKYAAQGLDPEFERGVNAYDILGFPKPDQDHTSPSRSMQPLVGDKLYLCVYSLSVFTTHGGLVCDKNSKVLTKRGDPWKNLYAVGASAASFLNGHYPSHGMSIGSGVVFGYLAGLHATDNDNRLAEIRDSAEANWRSLPDSGCC